MKSVISAAAILIFIIILVTVSYFYTDSAVENMLEILDKNEKFVAKYSWEQAENEMKKLNEVWLKNREIFALMANHSLTEDIDKSLAKINYAVKMRKNDEFFLEIGVARLGIYSLSEQQKLSFSNIF